MDEGNSVTVRTSRRRGRLLWAVYRAAARFLVVFRPLAPRKGGGRYEQSGCVVQSRSFPRPRLMRASLWPTRAVCANSALIGAYFFDENCDVLQITGDGPQSYGGEVRPGHRTQSPIRPASRSALSALAPRHCRAGAAPQNPLMESSKALSSVMASLSWRMRAASASLPAHSRTDA